MGAVISLDRLADLRDSDRTAIRVLTDIVYPAEIWADWPGYRMEWAAHERCVRIRDDEGELVSYVGVILREAGLEGQPVRVGGVGGVKTHPAARKRGYARLALTRAAEFFQEQAVAFAVLVCESHLLEYYGRLGWQEFTGRLVVTQRGAVEDFTFLCVMTRNVQSPAPTTGTIDLLGLPW